MTESWQEITVHKPRRGPAPSLGQDAFKKNGKAKPLPRATVEQGARLAQHARCVDHVEVDGLASPLCILKGDDPEAVIAEARALAGGR